VVGQLYPPRVGQLYPISIWELSQRKWLAVMHSNTAQNVLNKRSTVRFKRLLAVE